VVTTPDGDPCGATIGEPQSAMSAGRLTSARLTERFLQRVEMYDRSGPRLNAVLEVNPDARLIAVGARRGTRLTRRPRAAARDPIFLVGPGRRRSVIIRP
jgi:hypothetical protein